MRMEDFELFASVAKQRAGIALTRDKAYLLESRLMPVVRRCNLKTLDELADAIRIKHEEPLMRELAEAMTVNDTHFFRDIKIFEKFRTTLLPHLIQERANTKQLRFFSIGTSSGQEAYSIAMMCEEEAANLQGWKIDIIASDFSAAMIDRAKTGLYSLFEVQRGLPIAMLLKHFQAANDKWQIKDNLRHMVQFRQENLFQITQATGNFDIVLCRNVLNFLDPETQTQALDTLAEIIPGGSILWLGKNERAEDCSNKFAPLQDLPGFYTPA